MSLIEQHESTRPNDFALLVGVEHYPHAGYTRLNGPRNDVSAFYDWLVSKDGGDVPPGNIKVLLSPEPNQDPAPTDYPPTQYEAWNWLKSVVFSSAQTPIKRMDGRLYLFFAGHGFSNFIEQINHAALYTGNANRFQPSHVCGTKMANWCAHAALFGEIVLIMDCCRDKEVSKLVDPAPFLAISDNQSRKVKKLEIYAVPFDGKAQEKEFQGEGKVHGVLTYALLHALRSAPLQKSNNIHVRNTQAIKSFIEGAWGTIVGDDPIESPEFVLPMRGDITFSSAPPKTITKTVTLSTPLTTDGELRVLGSDGILIGSAHLDTSSGTYTCDGYLGSGSFPFDGKRISLELQPAIYEIVLIRPAHQDNHVFLNVLGGGDVVINI